MITITVTTKSVCFHQLYKETQDDEQDPAEDEALQEEREQVPSEQEKRDSGAGRPM